ncbi:MAG: nucleotide exchange factor GrpE, partial [Pyrinomonadaceae bacterium]|nr:nucleotide exchange factor GrpE [Pyrinomonadaceae bacterium]
MTSENDETRRTRIPVRFVDDNESDAFAESNPADMDRSDPDNENLNEVAAPDEDLPAIDLSNLEEFIGGPDTAELVATRAELKRVETESAELKDRFARRQADFENYRKRVERERGESHNRVVVDVAAKLLPVLDNLKRALETEASVEANESDEFRHFLSGVDLICKQLNGVLETLGVKPVPSVGEQGLGPHRGHVHGWHRGHGEEHPDVGVGHRPRFCVPYTHFDHVLA